MIEFELLHPGMTHEALGHIPEFVDERNPQPAKTQLHNNYLHGGGWQPFKGFRLGADNSLSYPGDPTMKPLAQAKLRDETIVFYAHSWVAIIQPDRSFEVSRMD